jgi:hypothetical protein
MKLLWAVEEEARGRPPEARQAVRRATSADIVQALFDLWERELPRISGKTKLAEAIRYARSHRAALTLFLDDGRVEIDSNIVERAIRPQTITRKNSLFAGSVGGGDRSRPARRPRRTIGRNRQAFRARKLAPPRAAQQACGSVNVKTRAPAPRQPAPPRKHHQVDQVAPQAIVAGLVGSSARLPPRVAALPLQQTKARQLCGQSRPRLHPSTEHGARQLRRPFGRFVRGLAAQDQ